MHLWYYKRTCHTAAIFAKKIFEMSEASASASRTFSAHEEAESKRLYDCIQKTIDDLYIIKERLMEVLPIAPIEILMTIPRYK